MLIHRRGFTLIELLVVMGIMLILVSLAIPAVNTARNKAKDTEVKAGCNTIQAALEKYAADHTGMYPGAQWLRDRNDNWHVGPGVIGALPSYDGTNPRKDFTVPKTNIDDGQNDFRDPYIDNGTFNDPSDDTPNPQVLDALVVNGYLTDYPPNPFLTATGAGKAQMSNLFLFNPIIGGNGVPNPGNINSLDFNRYTPNSAGTTMRQSYIDFGRGFFTYIPFNPDNNIYAEDWPGGDYDLDTGVGGFYARCRSYMLVGWGNNRMDETQGKGLSMKYWFVDSASGDSWFDFDHNMRLDMLEANLRDSTTSGIVGREMLDSDSNAGAFGGGLPGGAVNIDPAFFGATFLYITGS